MSKNKRESARNSATKDVLKQNVNAVQEEETRTEVVTLAEEVATPEAPEVSETKVEETTVVAETVEESEAKAEETTDEAEATEESEAKAEETRS